MKSSDFTNDPRCWDSPLKSACAFVNKGFGLSGKEKRFEEVKVYKK